MTRNPSLQERQAQLLIDQLLSESLLESPTAEDLGSAFLDGDGALLRQLVNPTGIELMMALPEEDRSRLTSHIGRILDHVELSVARTGQGHGQARRVLAQHDVAALKAALGCGLNAANR